MKALVNHWLYKMEQIKIVNADEDRVFDLPKGDEPYFMTIQFQTVLGKPKSTEVTKIDIGNRNWAKNSKAGTIKDIPKEMGEMTFASIPTYTSGDLKVNKPIVFGALVIAMEYSRTASSDIKKFHEQIAKNLKTEVDILVADSDLSIIIGLEDKVKETAKKIRDLHLSVGNKIKLGFKSLFKPDDFIGYHLTAYLSTEKIIKLPVDDPKLTFDYVGQKSYTLKTNPIVFKSTKHGAEYHVSASLKSTKLK